MLQQFIIQLVSDPPNDKLIPDAYLTNEEKIGTDIQELLSNHPYVYGLPVYIKIISMMDRSLIPSQLERNENDFD
jgi:hypothetical protein